MIRAIDTKRSDHMKATATDSKIWNEQYVDNKIKENAHSI